MPFDPSTATVLDAPKKARFDPSSATPVDPIAEMSNPANAPEYLQAQKEAVGVRTAARREREKFVQENVKLGVPIDIDAELPSTLRARVSFESNVDKQADLISKEPGILGARKSKDGRNVLVKIAGGDGKEKEVLLHPKTSTLTMGDVAGATAPILKTVGVGAIAAGTGGMALLPTAAAVGGGAALLEAGSSGASRVLAGQDIDAKDLALRSAGEGAINAALPLAGAAVKAGVQKVGGVFRKGAGELERRLPLAADRLNLPTSIGETTGSPALSKLGRLTPEEETARQSALRTTKLDAVSGSQPLASEAEIAERVQPVFAEAERTAAAGVRAAMTDAEKAAQASIQARLDSGLVPTNLTHTEAGNFIRGKIEAVRDSFQEAAKKNYGDLYALADAEGIAIPTGPISKLAKEIESKDPQGAIEQIVPEIRRIFSLESALTSPPSKGGTAGILDRFGREIPVLAEPVKVTLPQAIELRAVINDKISRGEAVGDIPGRYLKDLAKSLTEAIDQGVKTGSPELQAAFTKAREAYSKDIGKFSTADIGRIFADPETARALGDDEIIPALFRGKGNLDAVRKIGAVLGTNSNEYKLMLRQGLQSIIDDARAGTDLIDAGKFLSRIGGLSDELQKEALGPAAASIRAKATLMSRAQGAKISEEELLDAMSVPSRAVSLLEQAIAREEAYQQTYNSTIQRQLRDGVLGPRTMGSADDFVTRFIDGKNTSVSDVRQALTQLSAKAPDTVEAIRQRTMQNILDASRAKAPLGKATTGEVEDLSAEKLMSFLDGTNREKYGAVLGQRGIAFLDDLATYAEATAKRQINEQGRHVAPETLAKETASGLAGFRRNAIGALVDVVAPTVRTLGGGAAVRNPAVRRFLETGELPALNQIARTAVLAAPQAEKAREAVLAEQP